MYIAKDSNVNFEKQNPLHVWYFSTLLVLINQDGFYHILITQYFWYLLFCGSFEININEMSTFSLFCFLKLNA